MVARTRGGAGGVTRRSRIREVAEDSGVSVGTVSNVLNNPDLVAEATRRRVEESIRRLGFVRNASARRLRSGGGNAVGVIVLDVGNPFFTEVARGIEDRLAEADCVPMLCSSDERDDREARYLRLLEDQGVNGLLVTPAGPDLGRLAAIRRRGTPVVLLDRPSPDPELCSVAVDDVRGGDLAAGHLLALGHERIAFVNGPGKIRQCADRAIGVREALRAAGFDPATHLREVTIPTLNAGAGEAAVEQVLAGPRPPTGIVCVNDLAALGVLRGLRRRGLNAPADMAVVGYDDVEFAAELSPSLTSIRQPKYQLGRSAADLLLAELESGTGHRHRQVLFQPELVVRESSRRSPGRDDQ
jgi:LacI family transcriptional regulator